MEGKPEQAAFSAARAFAAQRKGKEQLAVVTYNVAPTVALPFTTDQAKIDLALSKQPVFLFGTHIYDAVSHSLKLLRDAQDQSGNADPALRRSRASRPGDSAPDQTLEGAAAAARSGPRCGSLRSGSFAALEALLRLEEARASTREAFIETT